MPRRWLKFLPFLVRGVVSVIIVVIALAVFFALLRSRPEVPQNPARDQPLLVRAVVVERVPVRRTWTGFGTARAMDAADVAAEIAGIVSEVPAHIEPGFRVEPGEVIARLDPADFEQEVEIARQAVARLQAQIARIEVLEASLQGRLALAETETGLAARELERVRESNRRGGATEVEVERAERALTTAQRTEAGLREQFETLAPDRADLEAQLATAGARVRIAERNLERNVIRSPIAGQLQVVEVEIGERVGPGERIARVVNLDRIEIPLRFPVTARQWMSDGDPAELRSEVDPDLVWEGKLIRMAPESEADTRTFVAYAEVEQTADSEPLLSPGQFVIAAVESSRPAERLIVPRRSITDGAVWAVVDGAVDRRLVTVAYNIEARTETTEIADREWSVLADASDIDEGDQVVVTNLDEMVDGMAVRAVSYAPAIASDGSDEPGPDVPTDERIGG